MLKTLAVLFLILLELSCKPKSCLDCEGFYVPPLHYAAKNEDKEEVERLLEKGAGVNDRNYNGRTALHLVSRIGLPDMVSFLIEKRAKVNAKSEGGFTPLHGVGNVETARILLDNGAKITAKNNSGRIPLYYAMSSEETELALFLINRGGAKGNEDKMLLFSVWENKEDVAKLLFEKGANPYVKDSDGDSTMSIAKERNYEELIKLFETYKSSSSKN